jgi:hypothetical protein
MSKANTKSGDKAYREARKNGKTKSEAKQAYHEANEKWKKEVRKSFEKYKDFDVDLSDFNNSKNSGRWHTSEDL